MLGTGRPDHDTKVGDHFAEDPLTPSYVKGINSLPSPIALIRSLVICRQDPQMNYLVDRPPPDAQSRHKHSSTHLTASSYCRGWAWEVLTLLPINWLKYPYLPWSPWRPWRLSFSVLPSNNALGERTPMSATVACLLPRWLCRVRPVGARLALLVCVLCMLMTRRLACKVGLGSEKE